MPSTVQEGGQESWTHSFFVLQMPMGPSASSEGLGLAAWCKRQESEPDEGPVPAPSQAKAPGTVWRQCAGALSSGDSHFGKTPVAAIGPGLPGSGWAWSQVAALLAGEGAAVDSPCLGGPLSVECRDQ